MRLSPQRLAWIAMLSALVVFCLLCIGTVAFTRWFIFDSPTDLNVKLYAGLGTIGLAEQDQTERVVRDSGSVPDAATMTTDPLSQGYLEFSDPYDGTVVATATLRQNSQTRLINATRPRFDVSDDPYVVRLSHLAGRLDVWVSEGLNREIRLVISTPYGTVRIGEPGNFLIAVRSDPGYVSVVARKGSATLETDHHRPQLLTAPSQGVYRDGDPTVTVGPGPVDLLPDWDFSASTTEDWSVGWNCTFARSSEYPDAVPGTFNYAREDGRAVIHITRYMTEPAPGDTLCIRYLNTPETGLDVTGYDDLRLRVSMRIHHQSLSACGILGTECPIMLKMTYLDIHNVPQVWYHGFYVRFDPNQGGKKICDSCVEAHEQISKDTWYSYESGNLLTDYYTETSSLQPPASIISLQFYAAGHEYDVMLDEVALIASKADENGFSAFTIP